MKEKEKKMACKFLVAISLIFCCIFLADLQAGLRPSPKVTPAPKSLPQDDMANPFGEGGNGLEGPPSLDGPPELPMEDEMMPPKRGAQKGPPSGKPPLEGDFSEDFGPLPPDAGMPDDLPSLPQEKAQKEKVPVPVKEEAPQPFSWSSIDLHNLAKQSGRKVDTYRA